MKTLVGDVPDGWSVRPLKEVGDVIAGPSGKLVDAADHADAGVQIIAPRNINGGRIVGGDAAFVPPGKARRLERYRLTLDDIVGVRTASIGRYALVGPAHADCLLGTACLRIRPKKNSVDPRYLLHYLRNPIVRDWIEQNSVTSSTIASINTTTLRNLRVVMPPMNIQRSIATTLSALDEKIAIHDEISRRTTELRDQLAPLLLTGALPPCRADHPGGG